MHTPFENDGYSASFKIDDNQCVVNGSMNLTTMVASMSHLQKGGLFPEDVTKADIESHLWTTGSALGVNIMTHVLVNLYKNDARLDHCTFVQDLTVDGKTSEMAFRFEMTRAIFDHIDWSNFSLHQVPSVTGNFKIGKATMDHVNAEAAND